MDYIILGMAIPWYNGLTKMVYHGKILGYLGICRDFTIIMGLSWDIARKMTDCHRNMKYTKEKCGFTLWR